MYTYLNFSKTSHGYKKNDITIDDDNIIHFEGDTPLKGRVILFSFPSLKHANEWYSDPDYQSISEHRRASVTSTITLINGLPPR